MKYDSNFCNLTFDKGRFWYKPSWESFSLLDLVKPKIIEVCVDLGLLSVKLEPN